MGDGEKFGLGPHDVVVATDSKFGPGLHGVVVATDLKFDLGPQVAVATAAPSNAALVLDNPSN